MRTQKTYPAFLLLSMLSSLIFWTCGASDPGPTPVPVGFDWQGHRGARGLAPENTVTAFLKALEFPQIQTLELDLAVSKDTQLIVSHEPWFNPGICRLPNGDSITRSQAESLLLFQMTAEEIRTYDCGSWGNARFPQQARQKAHKPALREVVDSVRSRFPDRFVALRWNMEIKSEPGWDGVRTPAIADFARIVLENLNRLGIKERTTVQSFDPRALQAVHSMDTTVSLALLVENPWGVESNLEKLGFSPAIYSPYFKLVGKKMIASCHDRHIRVIPWTVNEVPAMRQLIRMGVDGIITDYPDLIGKVPE